MHGMQIIGAETSACGKQTFTAHNPVTGEPLPTCFHEATQAEIHQAALLADEAFDPFRAKAPNGIAAFLFAIADQLQELEQVLIERAHIETGLTVQRLTEEVLRAIHQARLYAQLVREGSWQMPRIDIGLPEAAPQGRPDLRTTLFPLGPVAVFGASSFPISMSVAGTDTISALAAACPVIVKAHPLHPGTSEILGTAISEAARQTAMPSGVFSLIHSTQPEVVRHLVQHPIIRAVAFTGTYQGGRALMEAASNREDPIPVFAEMGSLNPVFVLPEILQERAPKIAEGFVQSITRACGQLCTRPGIMVAFGGKGFDQLIEVVTEHALKAPSQVMLSESIFEACREGTDRIAQTPGVLSLTPLTTGNPAEEPPARHRCLTNTCSLFLANAKTFLAQAHLQEDVFGPVAILIRCDTEEELLALARNLSGQLAATVFGTHSDLREFPGVVRELKKRVGRLVYNGFPTDITLGHAIHHGGPYPAAMFPHFSSIGTTAIYRFVRPLCLQDCPEEQLPQELQDSNPRGLWRIVDGSLSRQPLL